MNESYVEPNYFELNSVKHQTKKTNDLLNSVSARFGCAIHWLGRGRHGIINRKNVVPMDFIFFQFHGNQYANYLTLKCLDATVLYEVKTAFSKDFVSDVQIRKGLL